MTEAVDIPEDATKTCFFDQRGQGRKNWGNSPGCLTEVMFFDIDMVVTMDPWSICQFFYTLRHWVCC